MSEVEHNVADRKKAEDLIAFVRHESSLLGLHGFAIFWQAMAEDAKRWVPHTKPEPESRPNHVAQALRQVQRIVDLADDVEHDEGQAFADDASQTAREIGETIERTVRVTDNQQEALDNIERGIAAWIR